MAATADDLLVVLKSIDVSLKALVAAQPKPPPQLADASDLDGQYGDPIIMQKDPRDWRGDTQHGKRYSECPPEYLDLVASRLDYFAEKADAENKLTAGGKPVGPLNRRDAARARGWAARLRGGWKSSTPAAAAAQPSMMESLGDIFGAAPPVYTDDEIPF